MHGALLYRALKEKSYTAMIYKIYDSPAAEPTHPPSTAKRELRLTRAKRHHSHRKLLIRSRSIVLDRKRFPGHAKPIDARQNPPHCAIAPTDKHLSVVSFQSRRTKKQKTSTPHEHRGVSVITAVVKESRWVETNK